MNIVDTHNFIAFIESKERGAFHTIEEIDMLLERAQMQRFGQYYELYGKNQPLHDSLSTFLTKFQFTNATSPLGVITLPTDCMHISNAYTVVFDNKLSRSFTRDVLLVNEDEINNALNSQLRPISIDNPIGIRSGTLLTILPNTPQAGYINYLRKPLTPKYAYTMSGRTVVYDSANSQNLEWSDAYVDSIILLVLSYIGINLNDEQLVQYGLAKEKM
jgi:hypothetical protein